MTPEIQKIPLFTKGEVLKTDVLIAKAKNSQELDFKLNNLCNDNDYIFFYTYRKTIFGFRFYVYKRNKDKHDEILRGN